MEAINELADIAIKISGKTITKKYDLSAPQGVRGRNADLVLAKNKIDWELKVSVEKELARSYEWIEETVHKDRKTLRERTNASPS